MKCQECEKDVFFLDLKTTSFKAIGFNNTIVKRKLSICEDCHTFFAKLDSKAIEYMNENNIKNEDILDLTRADNKR